MIAERIASRDLLARISTLLDLAVADDPVFLNDLLDLPQPTELRAVYDAMTTPPAIGAGSGRCPG